MPKWINYPLSLIVLIATWSYLSLFIAALVEGVLVPWDVAGERPPLGTLPRQVNDFFEGSPGAWLPSQIIIGLGVLITVVRFAYRREVQVIWEAAASNLIFLASSFLLIWLLGSLDIWWRRQYGLPLEIPYFGWGTIVGLTLSWLGLLYFYARGWENVWKRLLRR